jgi:hypothetical protein
MQEQKLDLLGVLDKVENPHSIMLTVFMDAITQSFDKVLLM